MATVNQGQQNQNNRRVRFNGIEGLLIGGGLISAVYGGRELLREPNFSFSFDEMYNAAYNNPIPWLYIGGGIISAFLAGAYNIGRHHGRN